MGFFKRTRKVVMATAVAGVLAAGVLLGTAGSASASSIQNDWVQLCAQGNYSAYLTLPYRGPTSGRFNVPAGECRWWWMGTLNWNGGWEPIDVFEDSYGSSSQIGTVWYNGSYSGVGIGAEGYVSEGTNIWIVTW
jgi:hypothetical protein